MCTYVVTSTPSQDERAALPSQQRANAWKRKSAPSEYSERPLSGDFDEFVRQMSPGNRSSIHSALYNDASKRRSQYYEEQFQYKDKAMSQSREKVQRQSPVIAELRTNVIVSRDKH
jgi:hypothetical protein